MKSYRLKVILDEEIIELVEPYNDVVDRLYNQQGKCSELDTNGKPLEFIATKEGNFKLNYFYGPSVQAYKLFSVRGKVFNDGKTRISISTVLDLKAVFHNAIGTFIPLILFLIYTYLQPILNSPKIDNFSFAAVLIAVYTIANIILNLIFYKSARKKMPADVNIMKNIIKNKLKK